MFWRGKIAVFALQRAQFAGHFSNGIYGHTTPTESKLYQTCRNLPTWGGGLQQGSGVQGYLTIIVIIAQDVGNSQVPLYVTPPLIVAHVIMACNKQTASGGLFRAQLPLHASPTLT